MKADRYNLHDRLAVGVKKYDVTIGHIPWKISCMCTLFIRQGLLVTMRTWWKIQHPYIMIIFTSNKFFALNFAV